MQVQHIVDLDGLPDYTLMKLCKDFGVKTDMNVVVHSERFNTDTMTLEQIHEVVQKAKDKDQTNDQLNTVIECGTSWVSVLAFNVKVQKKQNKPKEVLIRDLYCAIKYFYDRSKL
jgi:hypothetical protein